MINGYQSISARAGSCFFYKKIYYEVYYRYKLLRRPDHNTGDYAPLLSGNSGVGSLTSTSFKF